ncbi:DoxX family protein [Phenylobacterium deserti]|uniref:DoxX family protein n=1 Tax=Phenylobacterium deserti TaxID=1914756 RepID=A0A328AC62_9CAUL|nr:DoxX family protein [Phenylobacterium deserti]RAK52332.1 DoxX family protein [Phenylobacterium deserti]
MAIATTLNEWRPQMLSILRIMTGLLFLEHGTQKLLGFPPGGQGGAEPFSLIWWSGPIELVAGALITLGLLTRAAAFLASGMCAFAYFIAHAPQDPFPVNNSGDGAILYCFVFLYLVFAGPGPWSLDALRGRPRRTAG